MLFFNLIFCVLLYSSSGLEWKYLNNLDDVVESSQYVISTNSDLLTLSIKHSHTCSPLNIKSLNDIDEKSNNFQPYFLKEQCLNSDLSTSVTFTMNNDEYIAIYYSDKANNKNHLLIYNIKNNTIEEKSNKNTPYPYLSQYSIVNYNNQYLYIFGGLNYNNDISSSLYTINLMTYELKEIHYNNQNNILPRYAHNGILYCKTINECSIIIYGGLCLDVNDRELLMSDVWEYRINKNEWVEITPDNIRFSRSNGDSIIYNNEYYVYYGGYYSNGAKEHGHSNKILVMPLNTNKYEWFELDVSNSPSKCFHSLSIKDNSIIYSYGGKSQYGHSLNENNLLILKLESFPLKEAKSDFSNPKSATIIIIIISLLIILMLIGLLVVIFYRRNKTTRRSSMLSASSSRMGRRVGTTGGSIEIDLAEDDEEANVEDNDQFWGILTHRIVLPPLHAINKEEIKKLPYVIYDKSKHPELNECPICLDLYKEGDKIVLLKCRHFYHLACMQRWFEENNVCPLCKKAYNEKEND